MPSLKFALFKGCQGTVCTWTDHAILVHISKVNLVEHSVKVETVRYSSINLVGQDRVCTVRFQVYFSIETPQQITKGWYTLVSKKPRRFFIQNRRIFPLSTIYGPNWMNSEVIRRTNVFLSPICLRMIWRGSVELEPIRCSILAQYTSSTLHSSTLPTLLQY